ncbi:hypothetical protein [Paenibacillus cellulosilyticus]|uniref:hypothetical protein n=1 Tax=Paenibacillus cellulosilyticus TaxID=375489 RepID=UPI001FEF3BE5|nr:hypothetical protein [Paenibacillus cellulosilyticus]
MGARVRGTQTIVEVDYSPIDLRSENEVEKDRKVKMENLLTAEREFYITPKEAAEEARWTLGFQSTIPEELIGPLEQKRVQGLATNDEAHTLHQREEVIRQWQSQQKNN